MMANYFTLVLIAAAVILLIWRPKQQKANKRPTSVQELFNFKNISPEGIVELPGSKFRLVLEVQPVNMALKSPGEQQAIWLSYRNLLNSLSLPATFLVQTRFMDLNDYIAELKILNKRAATQELSDYGNHQVEALQGKVETKNIRDKRYYIILRIDTSDMASIESGVVLGNQFVNQLLTGIKKQSLSEDDARDLAHQEMENMAGVVVSGLSNLGAEARVLNKSGALEMIYATFNRDMASTARFVDADSAGVLNLSPYSLTPFLAAKGGPVNDLPEEEAI
ncbi:MAG: hypothetical protein ACYCX4_03550 [Bacillota bacterium]